MIALALMTAIAGASANAAVPCKAPPGLRTSPCMPREDEQKELMRLINLAASSYDDWKKARDAEADFRKSQALGESSELEDWAKDMEDLTQAERKMRGGFKAVIYAAQYYYGVGSHVLQDPIQGGPLKGSQADWKPVMREEEDYVYKVERPGKKTFYLKFHDDPNTAGSTLNDGSVFISARVLAECQRLRSPAFLAATIDHEASHFEGLVAQGGWDSYNGIEARAYAREAETGEKVGLDKDSLKTARDFHRDFDSAGGQLAMGWQGKGPYRGLPGTADDPYTRHWNPDEYHSDWSRYQDRLDFIKLQQETLRETLKKERRGEPIDDMHDAPNSPVAPCGGPPFQTGAVDVPALPCPDIVRDFNPAPATPAYAEPLRPPAGVPPVPPPPFDSWGALKNLAVGGCSGSWSITQPEFDAVWSQILGRWVVVGPDDARNLGLAGCPAELLTWLAGFAARRYPITWSQFMSQAGASRSRYSAPAVDDGGGRGAPPPRSGDPCDEHGKFGGVDTGCVR